MPTSTLRNGGSTIRRFAPSLSIVSVLVLYGAFRLVQQFGALAWSTVAGEGFLKILVWVLPSVILAAALYRTSLVGALDELGLWSNPVVGYAFGLVSALPCLVPTIGNLAALSHERLVGDVLLGPFAEEVLFRGVLFRQLYRRAGRGPVRAMLVSALIFGFAHLTNVDVEAVSSGIAAGQAQAAALVGTAILGGLLFAWLAYRWNSVWPAIGLHSFLNFSWDLAPVEANRLVLGMRVATLVIVVALTWRFTRRGSVTDRP